jgi:hypothetical protein
MVIFNSFFEDNLVSILYGLLTWKKHFINFEHARSYLNDIRVECYSLNSKTHHFKTTNPEHIKYGSKIHTYKRNKQTQWYIIYNVDINGNILINHITSNHTTI